MKNLLTSLLLLLSWPLLTSAQHNSRSAIESDFKQVNVVVLVKIIGSERVDHMGGYSLYRIKCHALEVFKGSLEVAHEFSYVIQIEDGYDMTRYLGKKVVFLKENRDQLQSLENSDREPTSKVLSVLRRLRKQQ